METYSNLEKLSNDLKNLFQNQKEKEKEEEESYFDFEIICEQNKTSFKTHKSILSSRSQYFKSLFNSKMKEYQENKLILKDVSSSILFPILKYLYSGKIEINLENAIQILIFSSKYLIDELIEISSNFIKNNLQFETIIDVLKLSERMNLNQLLDFSYQFIYLLISQKEIENTLKEDLIPNQISKQLIQFQKNENEKENSFIFKRRISLNYSEIIKDIEYAKKLEEWINDNEFFSKMKKGYSAKKDGFDCKKWHSKCDEKGKTLIIIKTKDNYIFGGFTQVGWTNDKSKWREKDREDDYGWIIDSNAFIFSLRNDKGDRIPEKLTIKQSQEDYAIYYNLNFGPIFGFHDFSLESNLKEGRSNFDWSYNLPNGIEFRTNENKRYLAGSYDEWIVDEFETYFI
ncbi:pep-cterm sorting domain-containing protein [Anaeramoeba ignava]|uniref:Pep-cterm sorting domain-containing protein n=1 Tax=Anaeramoeba ignava TaxID=1746090 RepID=A0A9Q0LDG1_ANAIG|nr:pep-cterm sorting domain-containing protein [Anaeramoeba ignava]